MLKSSRIHVDCWRTQLGMRADFYDFSVDSDLAANTGDSSES